MVLRLRFIMFGTCIALALGCFSAAFAQETVDGLPPVPVVVSEEFASPDQWYAAMPATFSWELPEDVTRIAIELATSTDAEPMHVIMPTREYTIDPADLVEGEQYLAVQFKNDIGWGPIAYRKILIDKRPPHGLGININTKHSLYEPTLTFGAADELSGIAGYHLFLGNNPPVFFTPQDAEHGYRFTQAAEGEYRVGVIAYDRAGNTASNHFPVFVLDANKFHTEELIFGLFTYTGFMITVLTVLTFILMWIVVHSYIRHRRRERALRREVKEVETEMGKIFNALRDEIFEQVQGLRTQKRLSKGEQTVVDNLERVLAVSETLLKKEVTDVKKILK